MVYFSAQTVRRKYSAEYMGGMNRGGRSNPMAPVVRIIGMLLMSAILLAFTRLVEFEIIDARALQQQQQQQQQ